MLTHQASCESATNPLLCEISGLVNLALDARSADREDAKLKQRITEFERKMQAAGDTLDDGKLTPEEKEIRIREVLGL